MKALILAAGLGTRLSPITDNLPKALVPVRGKPILIKQIENLYENEVKDITIVAGYKAGKLIGTVRKSFPDVKYIENKDYNTTNNMYSAYLARDFMQNENFLMMNGDVFFDSSVIKELLLNSSDNAIVVDIGKYFEESMKVVEKNGRLLRISKEISREEALGSSIDVYKFSFGAGKYFFDKCAEYIEKKKEIRLWSEIALNDILPVVEFAPCKINGKWIEIDTHEDLAKAEKIFTD